MLSGMFSRGRDVMIFDTENRKTLETRCEGDSLSVHSPEWDDEAELWLKFESQLEGEEDPDGENAFSFAEDGVEEMDIPPKAGGLIDGFSSLEAMKRERVLDIVKQLIAQDISRS